MHHRRWEEGRAIAKAEMPKREVNAIATKGSKGVRQSTVVVVAVAACLVGERLKEDDQDEMYTELNDQIRDLNKDGPWAWAGYIGRAGPIRGPRKIN